MKVMASNPSRDLADLDLSVLVLPKWNTRGAVGELWINALFNEVASKNEHI